VVYVYIYIRERERKKRERERERVSDELIYFLVGNTAGAAIAGVAAGPFDFFTPVPS